jgi:hypothetical protein
LLGTFTVKGGAKSVIMLRWSSRPSEWLALMTDPLLAQSAVDRLTSTCHELIVEGDSYRRRQRPAHSKLDEPPRNHPMMLTEPDPGGP